MKVLLINNRTIRLKQTQEMLKDFEITTVDVKKLVKSDSKDHDFIVLTRGSYASAFTKSKAYDVELDLIKNSGLPVFGICMGMQLIARLISEGTFKELIPRRRGIRELKDNNMNLNVYNRHRWSVPDVKSPLLADSKSEDGVEIIKHKSKLIWGVQFHPEVDPEFGTNGKLIFDEFVTKIQSK